MGVVPSWQDTVSPKAFPQSPISNPQSRSSRGFTLIEVLAAFAIGLGALGKSAQNAAHAAALDAAVEHAQSLFAEQGLTGPLKNASTEGTFDDGMRWTLKVRALPKPPQQGTATAVALQQGGVMMAQAANIELWQLDATVQYGAGRVLRLSTQRAQAAPPQGSDE